MCVCETERETYSRGKVIRVINDLLTAPAAFALLDADADTSSGEER